jgi:hypothetical protein
VNRLLSLVALGSLVCALALPAAAQENKTLTGKLVDFTTYVTHDHNMDSMHAMKGEAMPGDHAMAGGHAMAASCPMLGIVSGGKVYAVATQMGTSAQSDLCKKLNSQVTLEGKLYSQGGASVFLVSSVK